MAHEGPVVMHIDIVNPVCALENPHHQVVYRHPPGLANKDEVHRAPRQQVAHSPQRQPTAAIPVGAKANIRCGLIAAAAHDGQPPPAPEQPRRIQLLWQCRAINLGGNACRSVHNVAVCDDRGGGGWRRQLRGCADVLIMCGSDFPMCHVEGYCRNSTTTQNLDLCKSSGRYIPMSEGYPPVVRGANCTGHCSTRPWQKYKAHLAKIQSKIQKSPMNSYRSLCTEYY